MNKLLSKCKKIIALNLVIIMLFSLTACGSEPSAFQQEFENSSYKKFTIYKEYDAKFSDFSAFEKDHSYMTIESSNGGTNILFKGFYQIKCVYIGTQDFTEAYKTNAVQEFASLCGYQDYEFSVNNPLFQCTSNEIFNYNGYVVYCEKLKTGGSNLYLGKKFEHNFENDENATSIYNEIVELLGKDEYDKFDYGQMKDEYGNIQGSFKISYALALGLNSGDTTQNVLVGDTKYNYNIYLKMEELLLSLDKECSNILEKSKSNNSPTVPAF